MSLLKSSNCSGCVALVTTSFFFFFFNDTATTEIYTLSLHDALPISIGHEGAIFAVGHGRGGDAEGPQRSEEHTSELQSHVNLVCRLLLEKKNAHFSHSESCKNRSRKTRKKRCGEGTRCFLCRLFFFNEPRATGISALSQPGALPV